MIVTISKVVWTTITIFVLVVTLYAFEGNPSSDIGIFFAWSMIFLTFPSGLVVSIIHVVMFDYFSLTIPQTYLSFALSWAAYFVLGYVQWFVVVPYLFKRLKEKMKPESRVGPTQGIDSDR